MLAGKRVLALTERDARRSFEVNALAHVWTLQALLPRMLADDGGGAHVVTVASAMAMLPGVALADYCASKAAAAALHECLRLELAVDAPRGGGGGGVATTLVCTGPVATGMFAGILERPRYLRALAHHVLGWRRADDVAAALVDAIRWRPRAVYLPRFAGWAPHALRLLLPALLFDAVVGAAGGWHGMDTFRGNRRDPGRDGAGDVRPAAGCDDLGDALRDGAAGPPKRRSPRRSPRGCVAALPGSYVAN